MVPETYLRQILEYDPDTGLLHWKAGHIRAGKQAFTYKNKRGYLCSNVRFGGVPQTLSAHRVAWALHHGAYPSGQIDHINGVRTDNRISNLRDITHAENAMNKAMSPLNTSGVNGVYYHAQTGKWCAQISAFGKKIGLGLFESKENAVIARKAAERVVGYHPNHGRAS